MRFRFENQRRWPTLAWCAKITCDSDEIVVRHGSGVEQLPTGFCEAVWDGEFEAGRLDQTDLVFGSGAVESSEGDVVFVSSGSTVDRLQWWSDGDTFVVSNSLPCLLSQIDATVDREFSGYFQLFESIIRGIDDYQDVIPTSRGDVGLIYFRNLRWNGKRLTTIDKPFPQRDFRTFADYHDFLVESFTRLGTNLAAPARTFKFQPLATVSTGYDSPVGAAVGRAAGLEQTISIGRGRGGVDDDGSQIARQLGLTPTVVGRDESRHTLQQIPLFIASDAKGEDLYFAGSREHLQGRLLITGYGGSRVWNTTHDDYRAFRRGDQSGLSHTEARLHFGYLHCPTTYLGGQQEEAIRAIGRLPEMQPWSVDSDYNRPICRRIIEEAGVDRDAFGQAKKAASVLLFDRRTFLPPELADDYLGWIQRHDLQPRDTRSRLANSLHATPRALLRGLHSLDPQGKLPLLRRLNTEGRLQKYAFHEPGFGQLFPWALEKTVQRYQLPANQGDDETTPLADPVTHVG